jgi:hypothetical protein
MNKEEIEQEIINAGLDLQRNAGIVAEIMARQNRPSLRICIYNYANGFAIEFESSFFPDGEHCNYKNNKSIKPAISHILGITENCFTPDEANELLGKVVENDRTRDNTEVERKPI